MLNVFLDDLRDAPAGFLVVRSVPECIRMLVEYQVGILSLDHDLGEFAPTGYDLVKYMVANELYPKKAIYLHTMNPVGRDNMYKTLQRYKPDYLKLFNRPYYPGEKLD